MAAVNALALHNQLTEAGIPIDGVAYHKDTGWRVDYQHTATDDQRAAGRKIAAEFDLDTPASAPAVTLKLSVDEIEAAKTFADLKKLLLEKAGK